MANDDIQKITSSEVCSKLGGRNHKPIVILTPMISFSQDGTTKRYIGGSLPSFLNKTHRRQNSHQRTLTLVSSASSTSAIHEAAKKASPRGGRFDYKPYWTSKLDILQSD